MHKERKVCQIAPNLRLKCLLRRIHVQLVNLPQILTMERCDYRLGSLTKTNHWQDLGREEKMAKKTQARYQSLGWSLDMRNHPHCTMGSKIYVNLNIYTNKRSTISVPMNLTRGAGRI